MRVFNYQDLIDGTVQFKDGVEIMEASVVVRRAQKDVGRAEGFLFRAVLVIAQRFQQDYAKVETEEGGLTASQIAAQAFQSSYKHDLEVGAGLQFSTDDLKVYNNACRTLFNALDHNIDLCELDPGTGEPKYGSKGKIEQAVKRAKAEIESAKAEAAASKIRAEHKGPTVIEGGKDAEQPKEGSSGDNPLDVLKSTALKLGVEELILKLSELESRQSEAESGEKAAIDYLSFFSKKIDSALEGKFKAVVEAAKAEAAAA